MDGRGFPPDIAKRKLAKRCKAQGHASDPQYRAGFVVGVRLGESEMGEVGVLLDVVQDAIRGLPLISKGVPDECARAVLKALDAAEYVMVQLQDITGLTFSHEDGVPFTSAELRHFAGEALAAAIKIEAADE